MEKSKQNGKLEQARTVLKHRTPVRKRKKPTKKRKRKEKGVESSVKRQKLGNETSTSLYPNMVNLQMFDDDQNKKRKKTNAHPTPPPPKYPTHQHNNNKNINNNNHSPSSARTGNSPKSTVTIQTGATLLESKKLFLVLDLDHTLVHTENAETLEQFNNCNADTTPDVYKWPRRGTNFYIKLRPKCREFIQELSSKFIIGFYTQGETAYAKKIQEILDPQCEYVTGGILGQAHGPTLKSMAVFVTQYLHELPEEMVYIVDDRIDVWEPVNRKHVHHVPKYQFWNNEIVFERCDRIDASILIQENENALPELKHQLLQLHEEYFNAHLQNKVPLISKRKELSVQSLPVPQSNSPHHINHNTPSMHAISLKMSSTTASDNVEGTVKFDDDDEYIDLTA